MAVVDLVPQPLREKLEADYYSYKKKIFLCAQKQGYVVDTPHSTEPIFAAGSNLPATFVKWADVSPQERLKMRMSHSNYVCISSR